MARMTMRTREAPMDWEREHDRNLPNIFSTPQPLESEEASGPLTQRSSPFGSSSNDRGHLSKESSFTFQNCQKPFGQDSQLLGSKQGSFSFSQESSLSRPQSPSTQSSISSGLPSGVSSGSIIPASSSTKQLYEEKRTLLAANGGSASSFDMDSLKNNVLDHDNQLRSRPRSASRRELSGPLIDSNRNRSGLQYRSNTAPSSFWSDDEEVDDQDLNRDYSTDEEEQDVRHRHKPRSSGQDRQRALQQSFKDQRNNSLRREVSQSRPQTHSPSSGRVWSENVDLPFILSGYVQVAMNTAFVGILIYIIANFITTIQSDVSMRMERMLQLENKRIENCEKDYLGSCNGPRVALQFVPMCEDLRACMEQPHPRIARATVAAETFAHIVNSFVNTMSYKTMGFVMVIVLGGLYISNQAISSYRSNHVMHHQHSIVNPSSLSSHPNSTASKSLSSISNGSQSRNNNSGFPASASRENSFVTGPSSRSNQLVRGFGTQRQGSLLKAQQDSDGEFDMDM
ncbi:hypothetical protein BGX26_009899 [Mortierella sp. AD094]|nr:hypothetical protein BGX26_009899 [Mortierella sp. AD094]